MSDSPIGHRDFVDGCRRPIYEDAHRQYVLDNEGQRVHGQWLLPADEPLAVETPLGKTD